MHRPTFRQLQIFVAVARHRNFTRAAEELFLTQSSVSAQIKQLTDTIAHSLMVQKGKIITLTSTGTRVLELCDELDTAWGKFEVDMAKLTDPESGDVTISCVNTTQYFFPRILGHFCKRYPRINVSFKVFNRQQVMERIMKNRDDFYIMDYISEELDVKAIPFVDNPLVIIAHPEHPLANEKNIALEKLEKETLLVRETGSGTRRETDMFFSTYNIEIPSRMELGSSEAIKQGVLGGLGIGVLSQYAAALELQLGILIKLDVQGFPLLRKWNIAYPSWREITPAVRTFLDFLQNDGREIAIQSLGEEQALVSSVKKVLRKNAPA
jgi:DNA-binding transcriptional LysR family regulator